MGVVEVHVRGTFINTKHILSYNLNRTIKQIHKGYKHTLQEIKYEILTILKGQKCSAIFIYHQIHKFANLIKTFVTHPLVLCSKALPWKRLYSLWATRGLDTLGRHLCSN